MTPTEGCPSERGRKGQVYGPRIRLAVRGSVEAMEQPSSPITAVTHGDPYPYYAELAARRPLYRDDTLGLWVASSAATVTAVLTSDLVLVRPAAEPVPRSLVGSPAGAIFGQLVRMTNGAAHLRLNPGASATLVLPAPPPEAAEADTPPQPLPTAV